MTSYGVHESCLKNIEEGDSPVCHVHVVVHGTFHGVTFLGAGAQNWW